MEDMNKGGNVRKIHRCVRQFKGIKLTLMSNQVKNQAGDMEHITESFKSSETTLKKTQHLVRK